MIKLLVEQKFLKKTSFLQTLAQTLLIKFQNLKSFWTLFWIYLVLFLVYSVNHSNASFTYLYKKERKKIYLITWKFQ